MLFCVFQYSNWQGITVLVGSVVCMVKLVRAFQFEIKALVKWSRLGKARAGKVNFCTSSTFHLQLDLLVDLRSMGIACHNAMRRLTALRRQSCLKKNLQEKLAFYFVTANSNYIIYFSSFIHTSTIGSAFFDWFVGYLKIQWCWVQQRSKNRVQRFGATINVIKKTFVTSHVQRLFIRRWCHLGICRRWRRRKSVILNLSCICDIW